MVSVEGTGDSSVVLQQGDVFTFPGFHVSRRLGAGRRREIVVQAVVAALDLTGTTTQEVKANGGFGGAIFFDAAQCLSPCQFYDAFSPYNSWQLISNFPGPQSFQVSFSLGVTNNDPVTAVDGFVQVSFFLQGGQQLSQKHNFTIPPDETTTVVWTSTPQALDARDKVSVSIGNSLASGQPSFFYTNRDVKITSLPSLAGRSFHPVTGS